MVYLKIKYENQDQPTILDVVKQGDVIMVEQLGTIKFRQIVKVIDNYVAVDMEKGLVVLGAVHHFKSPAAIVDWYLNDDYAVSLMDAELVLKEVQ
jgi:hypothetical protein